MLLAQLFHGDGPCTCVVACTQTSVAALVDPHPERLAQVATLLKERSLTLAWVLDTRRADLSALGTVERFQGLVGQLGLSARELEAAPMRTSTLDPNAYPQVRPVRTWAAQEDDAAPPLVMQVGQRVLEVHANRPDLPCFDAERPAAHPFDVTFSGASLPLGRLRIDVVPLPDRGEAVAYRIGDRLLTGTPVLAGTDALPAEGTPESLMVHPGHTIVHAGVIRNGVGASTVALERAALLARSESVAEPRPSASWSPRVVRGGDERRLRRALDALADTIDDVNL